MKKRSLVTNMIVAVTLCFSTTILLSVSANERMTIVAFGDSTTASRGKLKVYTDTLKLELPARGVPVRIINAGIGGNHTKHARARFEKDVLLHDPDIVIIQFGINDAAVDVWKNPPATKSRISLEEYESNLRYLIQALKQQDVDVVLMTPNPLRWTPQMRQLYGKPPYVVDHEDGFNIKLKHYAETVRKLAQTEKVPLVDIYQNYETFGKPDDQSVNDLLLDGIHPNDRGHSLVADQLVPLLLKTAKRRAEESANKVRVKTTINPTVSILSNKKMKVKRVRFENYVSNPPPKKATPIQGWVGKFPVPFTGLVRPLKTSTTVSPLPEPIGMLIESSADTIGFYDPSSLVDCADVRADKLIFRFVDPHDTRKAATVSRIAFRVTGTSVKNGMVKYRLYDIAGKMLGAGTAKPDPTTRQVMSEIDCQAMHDGKPVSVIHKVIVEHFGPGYFVVGNVLHPKQPDLGFVDFNISAQAVTRSADEHFSVAHSEQWQNSLKADRITDMTRCTPAEALSNRREHAKWKIFEYETDEFSGKCLSVGRESSAPDLTLKLNKKGWHAVYIGLSTITNLVTTDLNNVEVRFTGDPAYTRLSNRLDLGSRRRDVLEEVFLGVADLSKNDLQFSTVYQMPARIHYVKTIPMTPKEVNVVLADRKQTKTKTSVATFDGFTWIHPFRPQNRADLAATFSAYRDSDFKTWWFQVGGADLVHHPTKVGNLMGSHLDTFPRSVDREYVESVRHLHKQGVDPLKVAVEEAHAQDAEILICLRAAGWKGAPPWEEFFMSDFYEAHPEWRCVDHDGTPTMHLSYAVEEVQDHLLKVYRESLKSGADGAGFMFHRGMPMMLWEEAFCQRFIKKYGEDPRKLAEDDPRIFELRAEIITGFIRKIRGVLDEVAQQRNGKQEQLKMVVTTFATAADNKKFGLDVERWIEEKLIDQIGIAWFAYYTSGLKTRTGDTAYYERITKGTDVKIYPFYVGWKMKSANDIISNVMCDYQQGADGIAVWDPNQFVKWQTGKNPYWPLISRLGHRKQLQQRTLLYKPVATPLTRLGTNHYSRWYPNTGF